MKIATFNLRNLFAPGIRDEYGTPFEITRAFVDRYSDELRTVIEKLDADILIVEEVGSQQELEHILLRMGGVDAGYKVFFAEADSRGICVAVIYRVSLEPCSLPDVDGMPVLRTGEEDVLGKIIGNYRGLLYAKGVYNTKSLHIFGMHLKANNNLPLKGSDGKHIVPVSQRDAGDGVIRTLYLKLAEARRVRELVDAVFAEEADAQIILLGDMNDVDGSHVLRIISGVKDDPSTQLLNATLQFTKEEKFSHYYKGKGLLIDHILISTSLTAHVKSVEIRNSELVDQTEMCEADILASDHAPVLLTLQ